MCRKNFSNFFNIVALCFCLSAPVLSHDGEVHSQGESSASIQAAIHWLESRQNESGSITSVSDMSSDYQATSQAVLSLLGREANDFSPVEALETLQSNVELLSTEQLARLIRVLVAMKEPAVAALAELLERRGADLSLIHI